jgi:hypothetical protein
MGRTLLWVYPDALSASEVWVWLWLAILNVVGSHATRGRLQYASALERFRGIDVRGWA